MSTSASTKTSRLARVAVFILAITASCVLAIVLFTRLGPRYDVTAGGSLGLTDRTKGIITGLDRPMTIVIAADLSTLDRSARQRTIDVLEQFALAGKAAGNQAAPKVDVSLLDTSQPDGQQSFAELLNNLAQRDDADIRAQQAAYARVLEQAKASSEKLASYAKVLAGLEREAAAAGGPTINRSFILTRSGAFSAGASDLTSAASEAADLLARPAGVLPVPAFDRAASLLKARTAELPTAIAEHERLLQRVAREPSSTESEKALAQAMLTPIGELRSVIGALASSAASLQTPRIVSIGRAIQARSSALIIDSQPPAGSLGITAIDPDAILSPGLSQQTLDLRARTEDLLAGALVNATRTTRPLIVIAHVLPARLEAAGWPFVNAIVQRASMRGGEIVEWAITQDRAMPSLVDQALKDTSSAARPVVFVLMTLTPDAKRDPAAAAGASVALSRTLKQLIADERSLLIPVLPSNLPLVGSPDPIAESLEALGISIDSGRTLLSAAKVGDRDIASPFTDIPTEATSATLEAHIIRQALTGLRTRMLWPLHITPSRTPNPRYSVTPLLTLSPGPSLWAEGDWLALASAVESGTDFRTIANAPQPSLTGSSRDLLTPPASTWAGPAANVWVTAVAIERAQQPAGTRLQRVIVIGSGRAIYDEFALASQVVDNKPIPSFPGNMQLIESSLDWLSGQQDQIVQAASAQASVTGVIPQMDQQRLARMRWAIALAPPALVLLLGLLVRLLRSEHR
jgi:hypothetical protein